ncbi:hypothetical protein CR513_25186, partial [Mucuna pruriens]
MKRNKCLKKIFTTAKERKKFAHEHANFSSKANNFASFNSIEDRWMLNPKSWWVMHVFFCPSHSKTFFGTSCTTYFFIFLKVKNTCKGVPRCETLMKMYGIVLMVLKILK